MRTFILSLALILGASVVIVRGQASGGNSTPGGSGGGGSGNSGTGSSGSDMGGRGVNGGKGTSGNGIGAASDATNSGPTHEYAPPQTSPTH